ncbi:hypothetical protein BsWGS_23237 [Bradybaena similaris]
MENIWIINESIKAGKPGTQDLYSKIPFFLRTRLDGKINKQLWTKVSEGCQQNDLTSLECAKSMYQHVLQAADEYIKAYANKTGTDNCILMMVDKHNIMKEFHDNAAAFVQEMDKCLRIEKELIFTYQREQTEPEMAAYDENITDQSEDADISMIEGLTQEVNNQLLQAKKLIEDHERNFIMTEQLTAAIIQGNMVTENLDEDAVEEFRHISAEFENLEMNREQTTSQIAACKQSAVNGMKQLSLLCSHYAEKIAKDLEEWKIAEARRSVKVGAETNTAALLNKANRFGAALNTVLTWFADDGVIQFIRDAEHIPAQVEFVMEVGRIQMEFQAILRSLLQIIVIVQPKGVISIENKGKKDSPNYCTKKTQPFTSTVRVFPGVSFPSFHILSKNVELVAERDLAQDSSTAVVGRDGQSCLNVEASLGNTFPEIQFNIVIKNFYRVEQNNVYKQFFRLVYTVKVSVNGNEYSLKTMSLPITFNTGANQILEHMGARMWYCASVTNLYSGGFQCPDPLSADEVINILDNRIAYIGTKTRRLTAQEKTFLRGRLPVASDDTVTMQGFLKDKMKTLRNEDVLNYSFYTWFYSVIHSIEQLLLAAWEDGIIYGFCSEKTAEEILMKANVPEGSIILRPSVSEIKKTSSQDATAAFVMEVKLRRAGAQPFEGHSSEFEVSSIPLFYKHIEKNTLYGAIKGIESNNKPLAKFLYGRDGGKKLDVLKRYAKKQTEKFYPEYRMLMEKIEKINIRQCTKPKAAAEEVSDGDEDSGREPSKRKRVYRKSSSNTQAHSNSQSPSSTAVNVGSPSGSAFLPVFSSLSSGEIKQENTTQMQLQSGGAVNEQSQRSGTQGKTIAGTSDEDAVNGDIGQQENDLLGHEVVFGAIRMDVSNIANMTSSFTSPHGQNCYPTASSGIAGMTPTQYNTQYQENGNSNSCFVNAASSPAHSDGYITSDNLMPASVQSNFSESLPSPPGNTQMSPPRMNTQMSPPRMNTQMSPARMNTQSSVNLPTVVHEAKESKRQTRRQGGSKGNSQSSKKSLTSSRSTATPVVFIPNANHSSSSLFQFSHVNLQNTHYNVHMDAENYITNLEMENTLNQCNNIDLDNLSDPLFIRLLEQRANLQLSPDSGVGDQSPSPESIWRIPPFTTGFQSGSYTLDTTNLPHL